ncbi:NUDIX domain-containing protein [Streptomyces griseoluteus]|uniref:NUDIX hydrolase n=1 Tax=Streptomyces griseoluteus TaxID=29306 RepID=UPI0036F1326B
MRVDRVHHNLPVQRLGLRRRGHHGALYRAEARHPWRVAAQPRRPEQNRRDFVRHNIFREYLLPGGHLEAEDESLMDVALRELREETGIAAGVAPLSPRPVHIDVHDIPANDAEGEPAHQHADVRYLFRTAGPVEVTLQEEEVSGWEWRSPDTLADATLRRRVLTAIRTSS